MTSLSELPKSCRYQENSIDSVTIPSDVFISVFPSRKPQVASASCSSIESDEYTAIGGQLTAPQFRAKCMRGSHGSENCWRVSNLSLNGSPVIGTAESLLPRSRPFSMSFRE